MYINIIYNIYINTYIYIYIYIYLIYVNFVCQCSMSIYISKIDIYCSTSYILVSSKPSKTQ